MKSLKFYKDEAKKQKYRNRHRKENYERGREFCQRKYCSYTTKDCNLILLHEIPDIELAKILKRSVQAIQIMRCRLKKKND